jgi:hypothetical protein
MTSFIEFQTTPMGRDSAHYNGLYFFDGKVPGRTADSPVIRVNGEPLEFVNESLPDILLRTLRTMKIARYRGNINCQSFAALMHDPTIIEDPSENVPDYFLRPDYSTPVSPEDHTVTTPVALGTLDNAWWAPEDGFRNEHMAFPAHLKNEALYIHKLGYSGQICFSGLYKAMSLYHCTHAYQPLGFATGELERS